MPNPKTSLFPYNGWSRYNFPFSMEGCVLYAPLWQEDTRLSPFFSYDHARTSCTVTGAVYGNTGRTFDGSDDNINCDADSSFNFTDGAGTDSPFTMIVWAKADDFDADPNVMISKWSTAEAKRAWLFGIANTTNKLYLHLSRAAADNYILKVADAASSALTWIMHAATYSGSEAHTGITLYQNGSAVAGTGSSGGTYTGLEVTDRVVYIGRRYDAGSFFDGIIGDVILYNRALSAAEIAHLYEVTRWRYQ